MSEKKLTILLADDDIDDCNFFKSALSALPLPTEFIAVHDGEELMTYLREHSEKLPNILFLDINMPRKNGIECLAEIKNNEKYRELPVVMFSTTNSWESISRIFKCGAYVYIHKPGDFAQLKEVIQHALPIVTEHVATKSKVKYILNA